jgi:hypothetical protein
VTNWTQDQHLAYPGIWRAAPVMGSTNLDASSCWSAIGSNSDVKADGSAPT